MTRTALIVAHGQPSDPDRAEAGIAALASQVGALLPGWRTVSATLAAPGALERALAGENDPLVLPLFMADGWFTRTALPGRLRTAGAAEARLLPAFGLRPEAAGLAGRASALAARGRGWRIEETVLVLAAHGSGRSRAPAAAAAAIAAAVGAALPFREIRLGFVEEAPSVEAVATGAGPQALCLPLFVGRWEHVVTDLGAALAAAGFRGPMLAPLGTHPEVPAILSAAFREGA